MVLRIVLTVMPVCAHSCRKEADRRRVTDDAVKFETCFLPIFGLFQWYVMKRAGELIVMKRGGVGSV